MWNLVSFLVGAITGGLVVLIVVCVAIRGFIDGRQERGLYSEDSRR
jgi:hypothetical protein